MQRDGQQFNQDQQRQKFGLQMMNEGRNWGHSDEDRQIEQQQGCGRYSMEMRERENNLRTGALDRATLGRPYARM